MGGGAAEPVPVAPAGPPAWPDPPAAPVSERRRRGRLYGGLALAVVLLVGIVGFVGLTVTVPRVSFLPGSVNPVGERISVVGADTYDDPGEILFVTVRFDDDINLFELVDQALDKSVDFVGKDEFYGDQTPEESRQANLELMQTSKSLAVLVALEQLGYEVYEEIGAGIESVQEGQPAFGKLEAGDVVTAVGDRPVGSTEELVEILSLSEPGDVVELTVIHPDRDERKVTIELGARPDGGPGGFLGVSTSTAVEEKPLPIDVQVDTGEVGGNSAGLALTLSIIDALTPGDLTGGKRVVVTGTIDVGGRVGLIGGIKQKAVAARRAGADMFIVPSALAEEASRYAGDVQVVPVDTLSDALAALADAGGNARELALPALENA